MISFARVSTAPTMLWLAAIPYTDWPQQSRLDDGCIRPAMVTDLAWHGFGEASDAIERQIMSHFPGCTSGWRALSAVMPGHAIPTHSDAQPEGWVCRVHVPLLTNDQALFVSSDLVRRMYSGRAYRVDTRKPHAVINAGKTPRVHLMLDIGRA